MAITNNPLTSNRDTNDLTSYTTASITPAANRLVIAVLYAQGASVNPVTPTMTGNGLTWVNHMDFLWDTVGATRARTTVFRTMGASPSSGTCSLAYGTAPNSCSWSIFEFDGVDTSGSNGAGAVNANTGTTTADAAAGTGATITLSALASTDNAVVGGWGHQANEQTNPGTPSWNEIHDVFGATPTNGLMTEWKINDNTCDASWTTSSSYGGVAFEIIAAAAAAPEPVETVTAYAAY